MFTGCFAEAVPLCHVVFGIVQNIHGLGIALLQKVHELFGSFQGLFLCRCVVHVFLAWHEPAAGRFCADSNPRRLANVQKPITHATTCRQVHRT